MSDTSPPLRDEHLRTRLNVAADIARRAGHLALRMQREGREALDVRQKPGEQGPVTAADEAAERLIMDALARAFPRISPRRGDRSIQRRRRRRRRRRRKVSGPPPLPG